MPTRNELLADHFMKAAGIAAVYATDAGAIGGVDVVGIGAPAGWALLCCTPGKQGAVAANAATRVVVGIGQAAALAAVRQAAAELGVGLTSHETVIGRAFAAVETVNLRIADLQKTGGMKEINAEFKEARKSGTGVRYQDFLHAKKMAMLEAIARHK